MPGGIQKTKRSARHHNTRKRRSTSDDEETYDDLRLKVEDMFPANTSTNTALVKRGKSPAYSEHASTDSEDYSESEEEENPKKRKRSSSEPYMPTEAEVNQYERFVRLRERATATPAANGHVYDEVNVGENARVIQGNAFAEEYLEAALCARKHHYKKVGAVGNGKVIVGDVTVRVMERFFSQRKKHRRQRSRSKKSSASGGYFRNGDPVSTGR